MNSSEHEIVIAGGGICGLATALALHRNGDLRSLKRSDLVHTLANHLPNETILFGQRVISVETNPEADSIVEKDYTLLRDLTVDMMEGFPSHVIDMVRRVDLDSLSLTSVRYRPPWDLALGTFRRGTTIVAGDAMHVIAPFIGQGGSAAIEDAIVLARGLACAFCGRDGGDWDQMMKIRVERAMDEYLRERKLRLVRLSMQTYLLGLMFEVPSKVVKLVIIFTLLVFFGLNSLGHAQYDCGPL
ncbi:hypothetical protein QJS10_CPB19g00311 [Acorus calamus]|uniref:FAD-binding domain-containing protein n=1 Tax=Acorus calamus TaxID=4465 RepID=A0AAV9CEZ4_ACOCL|nr:hypothetical protein QJS10_CPB19g00311 [Acorus calamus]